MTVNEPSEVTLHKTKRAALVIIATIIYIIGVAIYRDVDTLAILGYMTGLLQGAILGGLGFIYASLWYLRKGAINE